MKEPNLNAMLDFLFDLGKELEKDNNDSAMYNVYEVVSKMQGRDVEKEIAQLLYFCSEERAATVENELSQVEDPQKQNNIFRAIVTLYLLTKNIVVQLLKKADVQPSDFLNIYDNNSELLKIIKTNVKWVKDNSAYTNVDVNHYNEQLNKIQEEIAELGCRRNEIEMSIEGYKEKKAEQDRLNREIEKLQRIKASGIDEELQSLREQIQQLNREKEEKDKSKSELIREIEKLTNALNENTDRRTRKYQEALNKLQKCMEELAK